MPTLTWQQTSSRLAQFLALTKPRVVSLIVFCAVIGMFLAVPFGVLDMRFAAKALAATIGIALTMCLTLATFVGYAIVYTVVLKPMTPQNIVIGGASGAMPPVLGWAAVAGEGTIEAGAGVLIIFAWPPPPR